MQSEQYKTAWLCFFMCMVFVFLAQLLVPQVEVVHVNVPVPAALQFTDPSGARVRIEFAGPVVRGTIEPVITARETQ